MKKKSINNYIVSKMNKKLVLFAIFTTLTSAQKLSRRDDSYQFYNYETENSPSYQYDYNYYNYEYESPTEYEYVTEPSGEQSEHEYVNQVSNASQD